MQDQETRTRVDVTNYRRGYDWFAEQRDYKTLTKVGHHNYRLDIRRCDVMLTLVPNNDPPNPDPRRYQPPTYRQEEESSCRQLTTRWLQLEEARALKELERPVN